MPFSSWWSSRGGHPLSYCYNLPSGGLLVWKNRDYKEKKIFPCNTIQSFYKKGIVFTLFRFRQLCKRNWLNVNNIRVYFFFIFVWRRGSHIWSLQITAYATLAFAALCVVMCCNADALVRRFVKFRNHLLIQIYSSIVKKIKKNKEVYKNWQRKKI